MNKYNIEMFPLQITGNNYIKIIAESLPADLNVKHYRPILRSNDNTSIHFHWFESVFFNAILKRSDFMLNKWIDHTLDRIKSVRGNGGHFLWTAHNIAPHEAISGHHEEAWQRWKDEIAKELDVVICMSEDIIDDVKASMALSPETAFHVIPHPHYKSVFFKTKTRAQQRTQLGIPTEKLVIGSIGTIRRYKGILELIDSCKKSLSEKQLLLICGHCWDMGLDKQIKNSISDDKRFIYINKQLNDTEYANVHSVIDLSIINYRKILNSGSIMSSLSLNVHTVAPYFNGLKSISEAVGPEWLTLFEGDLAETIEGIMSDRRYLTSGEPDLSLHDPARIGNLHAAAYRAANGIGNA